ncbi:hypothetical protein JXM67_04330 [candidate division WOR-3 bacterium]|nr:hypothetical protein [candidate division WOR-3 bacterium]
MIIFPEFNRKYREVLGRLIKGEKIESVVGIAALNDYLIKRMQDYTVIEHLPKSKPKEKGEEYCQRWMKNFDERQKLVIEFIAAWQCQILFTLLKVYQAGLLLGNPIPEEMRLKCNMQNETEWYELLQSFVVSEIYIFQNRLFAWFGLFKNAVKKFEGSPKLITQIDEATASIRKETDNLIKLRHVYVHPHSDSKFERKLRLWNLRKVILENVPGGEKKLGASLRKVNTEIKTSAPKVALIVKRKLLSLLNRYSGLIQDAIKFIDPGYK